MANQSSGDVQFNFGADPTPEMLIAFGIIIQAFARLEVLIQLTIAAVGDLDLSKILILTRNLSYQGKRDVLFSLMADVAFHDTQRQEIRAFLDEAEKYTKVRNNIAHSLWGSGTRPQSIKPLSVAIRNGKLRYQGVLDSEDDFTNEDFIRIADKLALINNSYMSFLTRSGLTASIERRTAAIISGRSSV